MRSSTLSILLLLMLLVCNPVLTITRGSRSSTTSSTLVRLEPASIVLGPGYVVGENFTLTAKIDDVEDLYGSELKIEWNTTFIEYIEHINRVPVEEHPNGILHEPVLFVLDEVNVTDGWFSIAVTSLSPAPPFYGNGTVFEITFAVKHQPLKPAPDANFLIDFTLSSLASTCCPISHFTENCNVTIKAWRTITVPDDYTTIQGAINAASDGDTIFVRNGIYLENVVVNKSVSLIGEDSSNTVVTGDSGKVMEVVVDNVNLTGFKVQNEFYGIYLRKSNNSRIYGNTLDCITGIYLFNSTGNIMSHNNATGCVDGIRLYGSHNNTISENHLTYNVRGVSFTDSSNNSVYENYIIANGRAIDFTFSPYNVVYKNKISSGTCGIMLDVSSNSIFIENYITQNENGIFLVHAYDNVFNHNNIINNTLQIYDVSWDYPAYSPSINTWDNTCEGNYWSNYNGTDLDGDGIGDTPYIIDENNNDYYPLMNPYWNPGDVNHDLVIDIFDAVLIAIAYGSSPSDFNWNCHCDSAEPYGLIDFFDVVLMAQSYGEEYEF